MGLGTFYSSYRKLLNTHRLEHQVECTRSWSRQSIQWSHSFIYW